MRVWANSSICTSSRCLVRWLHIILSMMSITIPGVSNPYNPNEHSLIANFILIEVISFCLNFVELIYNLLFSEICMDINFIESHSIMKQLVCPLTILLCTFPFKAFCIGVNKDHANLLCCDVVIIEYLHRLYSVAWRISETCFTMHLFKHFGELDRKRLNVHSSDESFQQGLNHICSSRNFKIISWTRNEENIFSDNLNANIVSSFFLWDIYSTDCCFKVIISINWLRLLLRLSVRISEALFFFKVLARTSKDANLI